MDKKEISDTLRGGFFRLAGAYHVRILFECERPNAGALRLIWKKRINATDNQSLDGFKSRFGWLAGRFVRWRGWTDFFGQIDFEGVPLLAATVALDGAIEQQVKVTRGNSSAKGTPAAFQAGRLEFTRL